MGQLIDTLGWWVNECLIQGIRGSTNLLIWGIYGVIPVTILAVLVRFVWTQMQ